MNRLPRKIPTVWVADLNNPEDVEDFKKRLTVFLNTDIGKKLVDILTTDYKAAVTSEVKLETYDSPSWSHRQAHLNGYRQAVIKLLKLLGEEI